MAKKMIELAISLPRVVVTYLDAYAELFVREAELWQHHQMGRLARMAALFGCAALALIFAGVAVMLWATTGTYSWTLWAVPLVPAIIAVALALFQKEQPVPSFAALRRQFAVDLQLIEEIL